MGERFIIEVICLGCGFVDDDVPFAPTSGFVTWECPKCSMVVDLAQYTGISYGSASNAGQMDALAELFRKEE